MLLSERSQSEKARFCAVPIIGLSGKEETAEAVKTSVVATGRKGGMNEPSIGVLGGDNPLCGSTKVDACHSTFVQPHREHSTESDPHVSYGLRVTLMRP